MTVITSNLIGSGIQLSASGTRIIPDGVRVISTDNTAIVAAGGLDLIVDGQVVGRFDGVKPGTTATGLISVVVGATGQVSAGDVGISLLNMSNSMVSNLGSISGQTGVELGASFSTSVGRAAFTNAGTVFGQEKAVLVYFTDLATLSNSGRLIDGDDVGLSVSYFDFGIVKAAVEVLETQLLLSNSGEIVGGGSPNSMGIFARDSDVRITNTGLIEGASTEDDHGAVTMLANAGSTNRIVNGPEGQIVGGATAIWSEFGADTVINTGSILGDVLLGGEDDTIRNDGTMTGVINLGEGADKYVSTERGLALSVVLGGTGDDVLIGGDLAETLSGQGDNDVIYSGGGEDLVRGGAGNDLIRTGAGEDRVIGGTGRDLMYGGADIDTFVFEGAEDSVVGSQRDQIRDFESGIDLIDISALAGSTFTFVGSSGFSGTGPEVRVVATATGHGLMSVDVDGDRSTDMQLLIFNETNLSEGDFVL